MWNYWQAAGPWDYKNGKTKHGEWVHPNAGYYSMDLIGIVSAYEHGLVFTKADIDYLIATGIKEKRMWSALAPYSPEYQKSFEVTEKPDGWGGLSSVSYYLMLQQKLAGK